MKLLLVSQYFWPENFIINDLVKTLVEQGHTVQVLTGKPNYPDGKIFPGYSADGCQSEYFGPGVEIHRVPIRPRGSGGAKNLFLNYLSFVVSGLTFFYRAVKGRSFDAVLVFAPSPITSVIPAIYLKWRLKAHLAVWIQDLWPESLSATGFIRNRLILRSVGWMVRGIYGLSDTLLVQSRAFHGPVARYADKTKIVEYPNSFLDQAGGLGATSMLPKELLEYLDSHFCLVFAGNLGSAQSVDTLLHAVERLQSLVDCKFVIVGSGSMLGWMEEQKVQRGLDNLIFAGRFPSEEMPHFFNRAKGLLVTLKREDIFAYTIPSKIQAYLAAGRPIIAALDGEGARVVQEAGAGLTCPAEDAEGLAQSILQLYWMSKEERNRMGQAGRAYFLEYFEMTLQSRRLIDVLEARIGKKEERRN